MGVPLSPVWGHQPDVLDGLRLHLKGRGTAKRFQQALEGRIRQLGANMVDGRVLPAQESDALRAAIVDLVRDQATPHFVQRDPDGGLRVLAMMRAYGWPELPEAAQALQVARQAKYPPPPPGTWPELDAIRSWVNDNPDVGRLAPGVVHVAFVGDLRRNEGVRLPAEVVALYAAVAELGLASAVEPTMPVFALVPGTSLEVLDAQGRYPARAAAFEGMDGEHISVYCDRKARSWAVFDADAEPVAKRALDVPSLLRFGLARAACREPETLIDGELSWDAFFDAR